MAEPLPQDGLKRVVLHCRPRLRNQQRTRADAHRRINRIHPQILVVVVGSGRRIAIHQPLIQISIVLDVLTLFTQIANL